MNRNVPCLYIAGVTLGRHQIVGRLRQVYWIFESWLSLARAGRPPHPTLSADAERYEIIIVMHRSLDTQETMAAYLAMVWTPDGRLVDMVDWTAEFVGGLPVGTPRPAVL